MTKEEFQELLQRFLKGECSLEEIHQVNNWFAKISEENRVLSEGDKIAVDQRMRSAIQKKLPSAERHRKNRSLVFLTLKIAASFLLIVLVAYFLVERNSPIPSGAITEEITPPHLIEHITNTSNEGLEVILPDSSIVELKPQAEISYAKAWNTHRREVNLVGEAFFEVRKDSQKPFFVYGGEIVTKVLGTSFSVKAAVDAESIEVEVHTGKVSVYEGTQDSNLPNRGPRGIVLKPNEKVQFFVSDKHWVTSLVEKPIPLPTSNKEVDLVFSGTPLNEIKESIERTYSIDIIIENEVSDLCTFTGDVSMMELYDLLDVICKSTGMMYEVKGTKILITGNGCQ